MGASKFLFNVDFGRDAAEDAKVPAAAHAAALAEAEARGYRNGLAAAEAKERTEAERRCAAAFEQIGRTLQVFSASLSAIERKLEAEAVEVAFAVARKLAPALVEREPHGEIAALATGCLSELRSVPHVVVRVNEALHARIQPELEHIAQVSSFDGRLVVMGETEVAPGDCRIEWADGGIVRDRAAIESSIGDAVARYVTALGVATQSQPSGN